MRSTTLMAIGVPAPSATTKGVGQLGEERWVERAARDELDRHVPVGILAQPIARDVLLTVIDDTREPESLRRNRAHPCRR